MSSRHHCFWMTAALALAACDSDPARVVETPLERELAAAKEATGRYRSIETAIADGYADIGVYMAGMGHHYLNASLLDEHFDPAAPELLVYEELNGAMRLVAVEYAVPTAIATSAPGGFTGSDDVWDHNTDFELWTLHAWVWLENADGIFEPFNPELR